MPKSKKVNVLQLVNGFAIGGAERKLLDLVRSLDKQNYNVTVCSVGQGGPLQEEFEKLGVKVVVFPKRFAFDVSLIFRVARLLRRERIDILQTTLLYADLIGALAGRIAGVPAVISWETVSHGANDSLRVKLRHKLGYRLAMKFVDKIVAVSDETKKSIIENRGIPAEKLLTIHYGVDLAKYNRTDGLSKRKELNIGSKVPVLGVVARLEEIKGHKYFIDAVKEVIKQFPALQCVLVGDGSLRQSLENKVKKLGLHANFHFLGFRDDVYSLLNIFDIFVLPSISEGLPNVILEAMACSKPVVATSVGGIPEAVVDGVTGFLVPARSPKSMAQAIIKLLENNRTLIAMGQRGRHHVEQGFSLQKQISQFQNLYDYSCEYKIASN